MTPPCHYKGRYLAGTPCIGKMLLPVLSTSWWAEGSFACHLSLLAQHDMWGYRCHGRAVGKVAAAWEVPGVHAPHDMAVVASPVRLAGKERPLALLVAETWEAGNSRLHKFILLPEGEPLWPAQSGALRFPGGFTMGLAHHPPVSCTACLLIPAMPSL